jgi:hypothetical protein
VQNPVEDNNPEGRHGISGSLHDAVTHVPEGDSDRAVTEHDTHVVCPKGNDIRGKTHQCKYRFCQSNPEHCHYHGIDDTDDKSLLGGVVGTINVASTDETSNYGAGTDTETGHYHHLEPGEDAGNADCGHRCHPQPPYPDHIDADADHVKAFGNHHRPAQAQEVAGDTALCPVPLEWCGSGIKITFFSHHTR